MKMQLKISLFLMAAVSFISLIASARAVVPTSLTLSNTSGDAVQVAVAGNPNSSILLSFLPPGASNVTTIVFGTTDGAGNFSTSIASGGYGIPPASPVYASINGIQSAAMLWPAYASSLSLSQTSLQIAVGQNIAVTGSSALILASNSLSTSIGAAVSGSQVTITGIAAGSGTVTVCGASVGCAAIAVTVGAEAGQTQITLNRNNITLATRQTETVYVFGGGRNGYTIKSNSNAAAVAASIAGASNVVSLYGTDTPGAAAIVICPVDSNTNCATLNATTVAQASSVLSFSQNNLSLVPGATQTATISGGPDNNYYLSSNSNSTVASAALSGNAVTLTGGASAGSTVIVVCSTTANAACGSLNASLTVAPASASATVIAFSQNVVSLAQGESINVTASGGSAGYAISSNSNPAAVTASISGTSNVVSLYGNAAGSAVVTVCSAASGTVCAGLYATVGPALAPIIFNQNNIALAGGGKAIVVVTGGTGAGKIISAISEPNVVSAGLSSDGNVLVITGGAVSGAAAITVCSAAYKNNCADLRVTVTAPAVVPPPATMPTTTKTPPPAAVKPAAKAKAKVLGASAFKFTQLLKLGSEGKEVSELQKLLKKLGYFTYKSVTGVFGEVTKKAVIAFQKAKGLKPYPGWVGPATREALNKISQQ